MATKARCPAGQLATALVLAFLMSACSTTVAVERPFTRDRLGEVNSILRDRNAMVTYETRSGERVKDVASDVSFTVEKARWTLWESEFARARQTQQGVAVEASIDAIRRVTLCDAGCHAIGALEGVGVGLLLSLAVGAIATSTCHGEYCVYGWLAPPMALIPLGALIGLGAGHRTVIDLAPPPR
jgi:hypothetical protein